MRRRVSAETGRLPLSAYDTVLIDTPARTLVDLCASDHEVAWVEVEDDAPVEVIVLHGPRPLEVIEQLGSEVGRPARPPARKPLTMPDLFEGAPVPPCLDDD